MVRVHPIMPFIVLRDADSTGLISTACSTTAQRALQNPEIFTSQHYKQAAYAVAAGIFIRILIAIPVRPMLTPPGLAPP